MLPHWSPDEAMAWWHSVRVQMRRSVILAVALCVAGCSSGGSAGTGDASGQSFACVVAMSALGLTSGATVAEARIRIDAAAAAPETSGAERSYYKTILAALEGLDANRSIGSALDKVPCPLE